MRFFATALMLICLNFFPQDVVAQGFSALARVLPADSVASDTRGGAKVELHLSQGVPYRLFTLDEPRRLVLDFQEVDWTGLDTQTFLQGQRVSSARFGAYVPGWSRMVLELAEPLAVGAAELSVDDVSAQARLVVTLRGTTPEMFAEKAGAPHDPRLDVPQAAVLTAPEPRDDSQPLVVMLDPGHGGIDPGAEADGGPYGKVREKDLMLQFAYDLGERLVRSGAFEVVLTREGDYFVSLERRIAMAHQQGADVFISLHADSVSEGMAHGSTVYILSDDASDVASTKLAERHDRGDLLAGTDLTEADDVVADVMLDLARQETAPRSRALAEAIVEGLKQQGGPVNRRPLRSAGFSVLKSADIPSVLIELGFLSSPRDLELLLDRDWRDGAAHGILNALLSWHEADLARRGLVRQ